MRFQKLSKDYKELILMYMFEYFNKQTLTKHIKTIAEETEKHNFSIAEYKKALKTCDFEDLHEQINDFFYQLEIKYSFE